MTCAQLRTRISSPSVETEAAEPAVAQPRATSAPKKPSADSSAAVDAFMASLVHPHKVAVEALREIICRVDPSITEGVKWNAPSFRTTGYFATTNLRAKNGIGLILHLGAKVRDHASVAISDPQNLLTWLAKDRAMVSFAGVEDVRAGKAALQTVVRQWIRFV